MVDADGATSFAEIEKLEKEAQDGSDVVVGSRNQLKQNAVAQVDLSRDYKKRAWYRNVLMYGFNFLVNVLSGVHGIYDTQCGFKLFSRRVARCVFSSLHLQRWAFDIEVLYVTSRLGFKIKVWFVRCLLRIGGSGEMGRD